MKLKSFVSRDVSSLFLVPIFDYPPYHKCGILDYYNYIKDDWALLMRTKLTLSTLSFPYTRCSESETITLHSQLSEVNTAYAQAKTELEQLRRQLSNIENDRSESMIVLERKTEEVERVNGTCSFVYLIVKGGGVLLFWNGSYRGRSI